MTVQTTVNKIVHSADGVQTAFTYNFIVLEDSHMEVYVDATKQTTGYSVAGTGSPTGGTVTFSTAPANGTQVTLLRVVPISQLTSYQEYDPFPAKTHEAALDAGAMIGQQLQEQIDRALTASIGTDPTVDYTFPIYEAGKALMWTESGAKGLQNSTDDFNNIVTNATTQATNAAASATAAANNQTNAAANEVKAQKWAEETEDVEVETGKYSAKHWAAKSENYAQDIEATLTISTGTIAWNWYTQSELATITLTANATLNLPSNFNYKLLGSLRVVQDATGGRSLTLNAGYDPGAGGAVEVASSANSITMLGFYRVTDTDIKYWEIWRNE